MALDPTPNHELHRYDQGDENWTHSADMDVIEERLILRDTEANRSNYEAHDGAIYIATDEDTVWEGDGTSWNHATRDFASIGADTLSRNLDAGLNDITNIRDIEFETLLSDLTLDSTNITGVDQLDINRLASNVNADGYNITNITEISADRLVSNLYADSNNITGLNNLEAAEVDTNLVNADEVSAPVNPWDGYELVIDDEVPDTNQYIRLETEN